MNTLTAITQVTLFPTDTNTSVNSPTLNSVGERTAPDNGHGFKGQDSFTDIENHRTPITMDMKITHKAISPELRAALILEHLTGEA